MELDGSKAFAAGAALISLGILLLGSVLALPLWLFPKYNIYSREMSGKAELAQAEWNKQILIEDAKAQKDSAVLLAEAEVERAKGVAESNKIIAGGLKGNREYLQYLFITSLKDLETELIYVPVDGMLPLTEATRLK